MQSESLTCGEVLVQLLQAYGVDTVFGIPGVHTIELYRGLPHTRIRHITPRHEQGAGFMADGYARVSGKPGVCFIITGPGMTNILTAMAQAYADSIPMLVISSVNRTHELGLGEGRLHELPNQRNVVAGVCAFSHTLQRPDELPTILARAFTVFHSARPQPVHIEIPINVITAPAGHLPRQAYAIPARPAADVAAIAAAARLLQQAKRPLLLLGGGCVDAADVATTLAEALDAPTAYTINAKGVFPAEHPLALGCNQSLPSVRRLAAEADVILAIGTELGETDYDVVFDGGFALNGAIIRIDIDASQINRNFPATLGIVSDAGAAMRALLPLLPAASGCLNSPGQQRAAAVRAELAANWPAAWQAQHAVLQRIQAAWPDVIIAGDSTQPVYSGNHLYETPHTRSWFNSATGYGTLGYGLPAAIGAKIAAPSRPVVALIGDGGIQFTLPELASALEANAPIVILLWNNHGYGEIKRYMEGRGIAPIGVDIYTPDFQTLARGFGCEAAQIDSFAALDQALAQARHCPRPTLLEINEAAAFITEQPA